MIVKILMWQAEIAVEAQIGAEGMQNQFVVQHVLVLHALIKNLVSLSCNYRDNS
jgi:hypothetical protein